MRHGQHQRKQMYPVDWEFKELATVSAKITDGEHLTPKRERQGYFLLSARNVLNGRIDTSDVDFVGPTEYERIRKRCNPEPRDVLISCSGSIGRIACVPDRMECVLVRSAALVKPQLLTMHPEFLQYALMSSMVQRQIDKSVNQGAQPNLFLNQIERLVVPVPPLPEQRAIAEALGDVDALIDSLEKLIAKKRDIKQAVMQQLLTGKTRLPGFTDRWEMKSLGDVLQSVVGGGTPSRSDARYWVPELPWMTVKDFATFDAQGTQEMISRLGLKNSAAQLIPSGTLITSTRMALGKAVIYDVDVSINQDLKALFLKQPIDVNYIYYWFQFRKNEIESLGSGSTVKGISISDLKKRPILVPTQSEMAGIAEVLSDADAEIAALNERLAKTRDVRQGMMQALLTGRTRLV